MVGTVPEDICLKIENDEQNFFNETFNGPDIYTPSTLSYIHLQQLVMS